MTDPYDEELVSAGNLENLPMKRKPEPYGSPVALSEKSGCIGKRPREANGGWRWGGQKMTCVKRGGPDGGYESCLEVRAAVGAMKRRNGRGAKAPQEGG